jgi:hypothetical protein
VITCNRCGNVAPAGAVQCQRCGAPLSSKVENTTYNKGMMGGQEQGGQELPAWLESLRVGERSAAPAKSPSSFSAKDLVEEGSLPNWMRPEQSSGNQPGPPSPAPAALRPAAFPGPNTDANMQARTNESTLAAKGFTARSLIDEQALPDWMKEGASGQSGSMAPSGATDTPAPGNIAASSLVQPDALPDWMRNLQPPSSSPARPAQPQPSGYPGPTNTSGLYAAPQPAMPPATPVMPPVPPTPQLQSTQPAALSESGAGFSARDLIDQNALPAWMNPQGGAQASTPPSNSGPVMPAQPAAPTGFGAGFSAHDLIDQNALPTWMNPQGGAQAGTSPSNSGPVMPAQPVQPGQSGFSASSLLDIDSLPSWLKESGQPQRGGAAPAQPAQGWQSGSFPAPGTPPQQNMPWQQGAAPANSTPANAAGGGLSAASFIDKDALPGWLRENDQQAPMGGNRSGAYAGGPQRVENMRVPSRPRGEIVPSVGESEEAANVFASMLGVASAAPNFPSAPPAPSMPAPPQRSPQPLAQPVWQPSQPGPASMAGAPPAGGVMPPQPMRPPTANSIPGTPQPGMGNPQAQGYLGVYGGAQPGGQNMPNPYAMGNSPMGSPQIPPSAPGMPPMPGAAAGQIGNGQADVKPAKRGLFNSIREWFFR